MIEIKQSADGILIPFKVYPQSGVDELMPSKPLEPYFKVKLKVAPEDGKANKALIKFLAKVLGLKQLDITVQSGQTHRQKLIKVNALEVEEVLKMLVVVAKIELTDIKLI